MYPANYFGLFPPFPRENTVFVAMSFDPRFQTRWSNVIVPRHSECSGKREVFGAREGRRTSHQ
jgi:hypothetical protein